MKKLIIAMLLSNSIFAIPSLTVRCPDCANLTNALPSVPLELTYSNDSQINGSMVAIPEYPVGPVVITNAGQQIPPAPYEQPVTLHYTVWVAAPMPGIFTQKIRFWLYKANGIPQLEYEQLVSYTG